jgi:hypothetical protein
MEEYVRTWYATKDLYSNDITEEEREALDNFKVLTETVADRFLLRAAWWQLRSEGKLN